MNITKLTRMGMEVRSKKEIEEQILDRPPRLAKARRTGGELRQQVLDTRPARFLCCTNSSLSGAVHR
jgi:hypothetical protein